MGRKREGEIVRSCFNDNKCAFCDAEIASDHLGNKKSHLLRKHKPQFLLLQQQNKPPECEEVPEKKRKICLNFSKSDVENICTGFVTECGVPLRFFSSNSFQTVFSPICAQLDMNKIYRNNIGEIIINQFDSQVQYLKSVLKKRIISIKIDSARRLYRNVLCLNAQYLKDGEIVIKTLAVKNLQEKHSAENIKKLILDTLNRYDINLNQIYSITSDNGSNMICCGSLLQHEAMEEVDVSLTNIDEDIEDNFFENFETIFEDEEFNICISTNFSSLVCIRCAAHTVQLSVSDVLKNAEVSKCFDECRTIMRKLRTPAMNRLLSAQNLMPPIADCSTRWSYSYELLKRLRNLEEFISENIKDAKIDWIFIDQFLNTFRCVKKLTEQLQNKNLLFGDFLKNYLEMILHVKKDAETSHISRLLLQSLNQRKHNLLQNQTVAAAMYLDPRLRRLLQLPEFAGLKPVAVAHLKALYSRMHITDNNTPESSTSNSVEPSEDDGNLLSKLMSQVGECDSSNPSTTEAFAVIENFNETCSLNTSLPDYWEPKRFSHRTLYELYQIIHATPATQVSVERAFSILKYIINDYRSALSDDLTEAILILRLN